MKALISPKWTLRLMWALGLLYLLGGGAGILLSAFLRGGYGSGVVDANTASYQGLIWSILGVFSVGAAWSLHRQWTFSLAAVRVALLAALAWEAWVFWPPIGGHVTDYWLDVAAVALGLSALASSLSRIQQARWFHITRRLHWTRGCAFCLQSDASGRAPLSSVVAQSPMRAKVKVGPVLMLGAVMGLCACSPQGRLARQFAEADCVVVTNVYHGIGISVTGDEARKVVRAVSGARKLPPETLTSAEVRTEFYRGTNFLGAVLGGSSLFGNKDGSYKDESGVFKALYEKYEEQHRISTLQVR